MPDTSLAPKTDLYLPGLIALLLGKALLHFYATLNAYGLHRDEYLYLAEGHHPMWGYMEGPPIIGWVAGLSQLVFGQTIWAAKVPVLLVGLISIYLVVTLVREFGGSKWAQLLAGTAWLLSPAYLGSNNLFQPVSFNQFCWLLIALFWVRVIRYQRAQDWYWLGGAIGLALLTKYSVLFYVVTLCGGMLLTPQRKLFLDKNCWVAAGIALAMWAPNIWWQFAHDIPLMTHMEELATTQLVNVSALNFIVPQFIFQGWGLLLWLPGLWYLLRSEQLKPFRALGYGFLLLIMLLLMLNGKAYYTIGAYSALLAAGGCFWAQKLRQRSWALLPVLFLSFGLIPYGLPILSVDTMKAYGIYMRDNWGNSSPLRWEDGSIRDFGQDYSDMHGWEEMVRSIAGFYHELPPEDKAKTMIYAGNYGHAGALTFFRKKYDLPEPHSFNASYLLWVKEDIVFDRQIIVEDRPQDGSDYFRSVKLIDDTAWPNAREVNYIYYQTEPKENVSDAWRRIVRAQRSERIGQ